MHKIMDVTAKLMVAFLSVVGIAVAFDSQPASAAPAPAPAHTSGGNATGGGQWHPWTSDGCSKVPNWSPGLFNFTHACQHHDGCYRGRWASRYTCDRWFLNDMRASCETSSTWWFNRPACRGIASTYYYGVRQLGGWAWSARSHYIAMR